MNGDRMPARKFYIRFREDRPESEIMAYAFIGFQTLGIETATFSWVDDIKEIPDLGPEVGISGYIGDVHEGLRCLGAPIPPNVDYPTSWVVGSGRGPSGKFERACRRSS